MSIFPSPLDAQEAQIEYLNADFRVIENGHYVICAQTKVRIALSDLRYWNVERQEAYCDAQASLDRHKMFET